MYHSGSVTWAAHSVAGGSFTGRIQNASRDHHMPGRRRQPGPQPCTSIAATTTEPEQPRTAGAAGGICPPITCIAGRSSDRAISEPASANITPMEGKSRPQPGPAERVVGDHADQGDGPQQVEVAVAAPAHPGWRGLRRRNSVLCWRRFAYVRHRPSRHSGREASRPAPAPSRRTHRTGGERSTSPVRCSFCQRSRPPVRAVMHGLEQHEVHQLAVAGTAAAAATTGGRHASPGRAGRRTRRRRPGCRADAQPGQRPSSTGSTNNRP